MSDILHAEKISKKIPGSNLFPSRGPDMYSTGSLVWKGEIWPDSVPQLTNMPRLNSPAVVRLHHRN